MWAEGVKHLTRTISITLRETGLAADVVGAMFSNGCAASFSFSSTSLLHVYSNMLSASVRLHDVSF
jgi:hypothetical protein